MPLPSFDIGTCLFEDRLSTRAGAHLFQRPIAVIEAWKIDEVCDALNEISRAQTNGHYLAGFIGYEAGYALERRLRGHAPDGDPQLPLLRFWIYDRVSRLGDREADELILSTLATGHKLDQPVPYLQAGAYAAAVEDILELILAGDIYQANYTFPMRARLLGSPLSLYAKLRVAQPVSFGAMIHMADADILSLSPELFVERRGDRLLTRPMKGTAARAATGPEDEAARRSLREDPKERAENLMIVDLLRNDLSRVCVPGTVRVPRLFDVETYPTLHTMTSSVEGQVRNECSTADILMALFPCGSVTGAPKIRAQEIIRGLESGPRGPYTGAIGFLSPDGDFRFNVAIRTATIFKDGSLVYPVGGGIVADSIPSREYDECLLKARVLSDEAAPFDLIETLGWSPESGFALLDRHLDRMSASAAFFHRPFDRATTLALLEAAVIDAEHGKLRVRLTLDFSGAMAIAIAPLADARSGPLTFAFSARTMDAADPYLRHKTTRRDIYEAELSHQQSARRVDEVLFENQYGELTEGTWTNLFVERDSRLFTPTLSSGLLPGTLRAELLESGRAHEAILKRQDLDFADAIYLGNSVRGLMKAKAMADITRPQPLEAAL